MTSKLEQPSVVDAELGTKRALKLSKSIGECCSFESSKLFEDIYEKEGAVSGTVPFPKRPLRKSLSEGVKYQIMTQKYSIITQFVVWAPNKSCHRV